MRTLPRQWLLQRKSRIRTGKTKGARSFRYWRIVPTALNSSYCAIAEIEMASYTGGANLCTGGTSFGSGSINPSYTYIEAFDGQHETSDPYWVFPDTQMPTAHAGYQFATPVSIREVRIRIANQNALDSPKDFLIQCSSNGTDWTTAITVTGSTGWVLNSMRSFAVPPL